MSKTPVRAMSIGEVAERSGLSTHALRFYEQQGLIGSTRNQGSQRRYRREVLRRLAFIGAAKRVGLSLDEIRAALERLPNNRTPTPKDWAKLSASWRPRLDAEIEHLLHLRDDLTDCIGCGCLSFSSCKLYNPDDNASRKGPGARYLLGDRPSTIE